MKPFCVNIKGLSLVEVKEIYARAIENGAKANEIPSEYYLDSYKYFGVTAKDNYTIFLNCPDSYYTDTTRVITLQQVREQFPLPSDKTTALSPRDLACFDQVADVIGEEAAEIELGKVLACDHVEIDLEVNRELFGAFSWFLTPQQGTYWGDINIGKAPVTSTTDISTESDTNTKGEGEIVSQNVTDGLADGYDMVKKPNHYQLFPEYGLEVKDINKRILDKMTESDFDITLYEASWFTQSMQYFERCYAKNGLEDLEKGVQTMQFVIDSMKERLTNG